MEIESHQHSKVLASYESSAVDDGTREGQQRKSFEANLPSSSLDDLMRSLTQIREASNTYFGELIAAEKERRNEKKPKA
jgi:hypothetical protein